MCSALQFLRTGDWTTCGAAVGQAGNGTAMRTAVLGLLFLDRPEELPGLVADLSRITHHDPRSIAGGVADARWRTPTPSCRSTPISPSRSKRIRLPGLRREGNRLPSLMNESPAVAVQAIAWSGMERPEFDAPIITPFVIPTVLAALWCLLRQQDSWRRAVASDVRLGGDVDTLGAIVGASAGVRLGAEAITGICGRRQQAKSFGLPTGISIFCAVWKTRPAGTSLPRGWKAQSPIQLLTYS